MYKKIIYILLPIFLLTSCGNTFDSVKRGLTGQKRQSADEFLIQKKDPLVLPPDYENLPSPEEGVVAEEEISVFEKTLGVSVEDTVSTPGSVEDSILRKIQRR